MSARWSARRLSRSFAPREMDILRELVSGDGDVQNKEIGFRLGLYGGNRQVESTSARIAQKTAPALTHGDCALCGAKWDVLRSRRCGTLPRPNGGCSQITTKPIPLRRTAAVAEPFTSTRSAEISEWKLVWLLKTYTDPNTRLRIRGSLNSLRC